MGDLLKIKIISGTLASFIVALAILNIDINSHPNLAFSKESPFNVYGLSEGNPFQIEASIAAPEIKNEGYIYGTREPELIDSKMCNAENYKFLIGEKTAILKFFFVPPDSVIRQIAPEIVASKYHQRLLIEHDAQKNILKISCV